MKTYNGGIRHMRLFTISLCAFLLCSFAAQAVVNGTFSTYSGGFDRNSIADVAGSIAGAVVQLDFTLDTIFDSSLIEAIEYNFTSTADISTFNQIAVFQDAGPVGFDGFGGGDTLLAFESIALGVDTPLAFDVQDVEINNGNQAPLFVVIRAGNTPPLPTDTITLIIPSITGTNGLVANEGFNTGELSLPVELSDFSARISGSDIAIRWRTEYEENNIGFNVYRGETPKGPFEKVNPVIIRGAGTDATPRDYQFVDETAEPQKTYYYYLEDVDFSGNTNRSKLLVVDLVTRTLRPLKALKTQLRGNFPNPFNPETWFAYDLDAKAKITIHIYDIKSRLIRELDLGEQAPGSYVTKSDAAYWDGKDQVGATASSGIYFYTFKAGSFSATRKMVILK